MKKIIFLFTFIFFYFESVLAETKVKALLEGNIDAKISIIVYESLTCSHCADFHKKVYPKLKKDFIDGKTDILHFLYENQKKWVQGETIEDINKHLKKLIVTNLPFDFTEFESCLANKDIEDHVLNDRINGAKKFKINSTPTLIINDKKFDNPQNYKKLKKTIEKLI